jgi:pyruvate dehydrogenase E1 component
VIAAADLLEKDFGVAADIWSATSFNELRRDGLEAERWNLLHPRQTPKTPYIARCLDGHAGPVIASTDYVKVFPDQVRQFVPRRFHALGTDGFGRSDYRVKLRQFFEVNRYWVTLAALKLLADEGAVKTSAVADAIKRYGIDPEKPNPVTV